MNLVDAIVIGLAGYRLASFFVLEDGPWEIFEKFREFLGLRSGRVSGFFPTLLSCIWCASVWTTFAAACAYLFFPPVVIVIAAMTIPIIVDGLVNKE